MAFWLRLFAATCVLVTAAFSCKPGPTKAPGTPSSMVVGAAGGTVTSADTLLTITIPAGALQADTVITVAPTADAPPGVIGSAYEISPTGTRFARQAALTIQLPAGTAASPKLTVGTVINAKWVPVAMAAPAGDGANAVALIPHLSQYGLITTPTCFGADPGSSACEEPFQCIDGDCAIPCRPGKDRCPEPTECLGVPGRCVVKRCRGPADCTSDPAVHKECDVPGLCVQAEPNRLAGQACTFSVTPIKGICSDAQLEECEECGIMQCTFPPLAGDHPIDLCTPGGFDCAYGYCWPPNVGCRCDRNVADDCPCGARSDGGLPMIDLSGSTDDCNSFGFKADNGGCAGGRRCNGKLYMVSCQFLSCVCSADGVATKSFLGTGAGNEVCPQSFPSCGFPSGSLSTDAGSSGSTDSGADAAVDPEQCTGTAGTAPGGQYGCGRTCGSTAWLVDCTGTACTCTTNSVPTKTFTGTGSSATCGADYAACGYPSSP